MERYGVGFTLARYQLWNGLDRSVALESLRTTRRCDTTPWEAAESFTVDYHPLGKLRPSRAGRFSAVALRAAEEGLVSWDTAAAWLETPEEDLRPRLSAVRETFPEVWAR